MCGQVSKNEHATFHHLTRLNVESAYLIATCNNWNVPFFVMSSILLPTGWILCSAVNFSHFIPLDKGHVPENLWKLNVKIPTSLSEDYSLDLYFYQIAHTRGIWKVLNIHPYQGHLTINRASFPSILIICSTNTFESKFAFIE